MIVIKMIGFSEEVVEITYCVLPGDLRNEGKLAAFHSLTIDAQESDYRELIDALESAAQALLVDALEDFLNTEAHEVIADDDDDDDNDG